jgi:hypothetical protein
LRLPRDVGGPQLVRAVTDPVLAACGVKAQADKGRAWPVQKNIVVVEAVVKLKKDHACVAIVADFARV